MSTTIRRIYNAMSRFFDRQAYSKNQQFTHSFENIETPLTAGQVFKIIWPLVKQHDRNSYLKLISAAEGIDSGGTSDYWAYLFEMQNRRAKLFCEWNSETKTDLATKITAELTLSVQAFPPENNSIRKMVKQGEFMYQQLTSMWKTERNRTPDLPHHFKDSDIVMKEFNASNDQHVDAVYTLTSGVAASGKACWILAARDKQYCIDFE